MKNFFYLFSALAFFAGCRPNVGEREARERALPLMRQAIDAEGQGNLDKAVDLYGESLMANPAAASAHLSLALLLQEHKQDFMSAAYHYQRYLDLQPGSEKEEMVRNRKKISEQFLTQQLVRTHGDVAGVIQQRQAHEIETLKAHIASNEVVRVRLENENASLQSTVKTQAAEIERQKRLLDRVASPSNPPQQSRRVEVPDISNVKTAPRPVVPTIEGTQGTQGANVTRPPARPRTHTVRDGENLSRIAEHYYNDPLKWTLIRDANPEMVGADGQIRTGQVLTIPPADRPAQ